MSNEKNKEDNFKEAYVNDDSIFKFLKPNNNDKLTKMNGYDLQDLIILIDEYYIKLRNQLGLDNNITFGLELEFENAKKIEIDEQLRKAFPNEKWKTKQDCSLNEGAEISSPILKDTKENWQELNNVCSIVDPLASIGTKTGGHIHVGTQTLGSQKISWFNFIKMWSAYENVIFRFAYGDFLTARPSLLKYAEPVSNFFWYQYKKLKKEKASLNTIISTLSNNRYQAVNFNNVKGKKCNTFIPNNTIEFRCPNGTLHAEVWQNNVNLFVRMLAYSKSTSFNNDLVEKRHQLNADKFNELKWYDEIYLEQALELCDMIFSNNLDKIQFLKQYLKSFEVCDRNTNNYPKAQTLVKKRT